MPLGLFALICLGVHFAADTVDDRLLTLVQAADAWLDGLLAKGESTAAWVDVVGSRQCTVLARSIALGWELLVDGAVGLPMLGYFEAGPGELRLSRDGWKEQFKRVNQKPTPMRVVRPVVAAIFSVAGAYAIARMLEGSTFVALKGALGDLEGAGLAARVVAFVGMALVLVSFGVRATLRSLQHADLACTKREQQKAGPWRAGLWGNVLALPLAAAVALEARVLLSFFL
jgi:hypothetical protein